MNVAIIKYNAGNIYSVECALRRLGIDPVVSDSPEVLLRADKVLFSGDTLFAGSIGRTDHPQGDYDRLMEGIFSKLMTLDGDIDVIPGHGPRTTITDERTKNPFLQPFNLPYEEDGDSGEDNG